MPPGEVWAITAGEVDIGASPRCLLLCRRLRRGDCRGLGVSTRLGCCRSWVRSGAVSRGVGGVCPGLGGVAVPCQGESGVVSMVIMSGLWASWEACSGLLTYSGRSCCVVERG